MIAKLMRTVKKLRPWMIAVAVATGAAWAATSCDTGGGTCEPGDYYGPPTCTTDEECVARDGPGSYCDTRVTMVDDGCGHMVEWGRVCTTGGTTDADADADVDDVIPDVDGTTDADADPDCVPAVFYGPDPICTDNAQCESEYGAGWTCTGYTTFPDTCDATINWGPFCEPPGDTDADADPGDMTTFYGPPPADIVDSIDDDAGTWYGPPPTDVSDDSPPAYYGPTPIDAGAETGDEDGGPSTFYGPTPTG